MSGGYLMDDAREAGRLTAKVDPEKWVTEELAGYLSAGARVLEVGCGPMHLTSAVKRAGVAVACGVDVSRARLQAIGGPRVAGLVGVQAPAERLPFADGSFDVAYARFLLQYLEDPAAAVAEMCRVTSPGGTVFLQDLDGQLVSHYPGDDKMESLLGEFLSAVHGRLDVFVGRKLYAMARAAGLSEIKVRASAYHLIAGAADPFTMGAWELKLEIAYPNVVRCLGEGKARELRRLFLSYLADPATLTYSIAFAVSGRVPACAARGYPAHRPI
ncbi:MAG: methyltransferase domain-containing protein [Acidimicrobiales bacterium]